MLGAIIGHRLGHVLEELLAVGGLGEVDEVDDDDAAHVTQSELSGDLFGGGDVDVEGRLFLLGVPLDAVATVDVDDVHGLGVLDDEVGAAFVGDGAAEERLDLFRDAKVVEDGELAGVELDDFFLFGSDEADVVVDALEDVLVVDVDVLERGVEDVAQQGDGAGRFLVDDEWGFRLGGHFEDVVLPAFL